MTELGYNPCLPNCKATLYRASTGVSLYQGSVNFELQLGTPGAGTEAGK